MYNRLIIYLPWYARQNAFHDFPQGFTCCRHIDTAAMYGNEEGVGKGIKIVDRKDVYITTKLKNDDHGRVAEAVQESLQRLDTDYLDTFVVWSCPIIV